MISQVIIWEILTEVLLQGWPEPLSVLQHSTNWPLLRLVSRGQLLVLGDLPLPVQLGVGVPVLPWHRPLQPDGLGLHLQARLRPHGVHEREVPGEADGLQLRRGWEPPHGSCVQHRSGLLCLSSRNQLQSAVRGTLYWERDQGQCQPPSPPSTSPLSCPAQPSCPPSTCPRPCPTRTETRGHDSPGSSNLWRQQQLLLPADPARQGGGDGDELRPPHDPHDDGQRRHSPHHDQGHRPETDRLSKLLLLQLIGKISARQTRRLQWIFRLTLYVLCMCVFC